LAREYEEFDPEVFRYLVLHERYRNSDLAAYYGVSTSTISRAKRYFRNRGVLHQKTRDEIELDIKDALLRGVPRMSDGLASVLTPHYDAESDEWVINDYKGRANPKKNGRKNSDFPAEIHLKYDYYLDSYVVTEFQIRGEENNDAKQGFQRNLP
jgi:DNA-binding transcriptional MocR family regulator